MKNEEGYVTFESKLNYLSLEELDKLKNNSHIILANKLQDVILTPNKAFYRTFNSIAEVLLLHDSKAATKSGNEIGLIRSGSRWLAKRSLNGKMTHIKASIHKEKALRALIEFCRKNNLDY